MIKWIVIYWVTTISYNTIKVTQWDSRCQCYVEPNYQPIIRTDTARVEFKSKKAALKFIHSAGCDFSGWRLDSAGKTIESLIPVPNTDSVGATVIYTTR